MRQKWTKEEEEVLKNNINSTADEIRIMLKEIGFEKTAEQIRIKKHSQNKKLGIAKKIPKINKKGFLNEKVDFILEKLDEGLSISSIAKILGVNLSQLSTFLNKNPKTKEKIESLKTPYLLEELDIVKMYGEEANSFIQIKLLEKGFKRSKYQISKMKSQLSLQPSKIKNIPIKKKSKVKVYAYISTDEVLENVVISQKQKIYDFSKNQSLKIERTFTYLEGNTQRRNESQRITYLIENGIIAPKDTIIITELGVLARLFSDRVSTIELLAEKDILLISIYEHQTYNISFDKKNLKSASLFCKIFAKVESYLGNSHNKKETRIKKNFIFNNVKNGIISQNINVQPSVILQANFEKAKKMYEDKTPINQIANFFNLKPNTVAMFLIRNGIHKPKTRK